MPKKEKENMDIHIICDDPELVEKIKTAKKEKGSLRDAVLYLLKGDQLPVELLRKLDTFFVEGTPIEKLNKMTDDYLAWHEKFPYLNIQRELTPEDAGFPPCPLVKAQYWNGEFLGFHCRAIKPIAFRLPMLRVGSLTLQVTTAKDCWECAEMQKGLSVRKVSYEELEVHKATIRAEKRKTQSASENAIEKKLEDAGLRMTIKEAREIFQFLHYNDAQERWKAMGEAHRKTGFSRPTINKLLETFPEGLP